MIGQTLGHYEILEKLGEGGMGEVYRATDTKLRRDVAIKVLPQAVAVDPERLARLKREAHVLASLNHPKIASIYSFESVNVDDSVLGGESHRGQGVDRKTAPSMHFLVMELAAGETLTKRIDRGPLPIDEAFAIAIQIADALEAAHEKGIIHRDLKPANIKVDDEGDVKVLDFGLAKALDAVATDGELSPTDLSRSPTLTARMTAPGVILGTAAYMAPEQAKGRAVDKRADIWAFGCLLFEMLSGRRAFARDSVVETLGAILEREPDWSQLPAGLSPRHRRLLARCLAKDRRERMHDIADARLELTEAAGAEAPPDPAGAPTSLTGLARKSILLGLAVGLAVGACASWLVLRLATHSAAGSPVAPRRFNLAVPTTAPLVGPTARGVLAFSPEGSSVVYVANVGGKTQLYLRRLDESRPLPIPGSEGATSPFVSPDGEWVGFEADGKLKKLSLRGGPPVILCDSGELRGASWGKEGTILFSGSAYSGLSTISDGGGSPHSLTRPNAEQGEQSHRWPQILPGGRSAIFTINPLSGRQDAAKIAIVALDTGEYRTVLEGGSSARYSPSGHLVYALSGSLFAAPLDVSSLQVTGPALPVVSDVRMYPGAGTADFDLSEEGSLLYVEGFQSPPDRELVWARPEGGIQPATGQLRPYGEVAPSPSGHRIAVEIEGTSATDIWIYDIGQDSWTRLTSEMDALAPVWSPDESRIAFGSNREGAYNVFSIPADGSGAAAQLTEGPHWSFPLAWSPDGSRLIFRRQNPVSRLDLWDLRLSPELSPSPLLAGPFSEFDARISPDGRWLAYASTETGSPEVYLTSFPDPGKKTVVSTGGGREPRWSSDGRRLFYRSGSHIFAIEVDGDGELRAGSRQVAFDFQASAPSYSLLYYDVSADGERFLLVMESEQEQTSEQIVLVPDFDVELSDRVTGAS